MEIRVVDHRRDVKSTRKGYFTLVIDSLLVKKCVAHKSPPSVNFPDGRIWFAPPAIQRPDGGYENVVCFEDPKINEVVQERVREILTPLLKDER